MMAACAYSQPKPSGFQGSLFESYTRNSETRISKPSGPRCIALVEILTPLHLERLDKPAKFRNR